MNNNSLQNMIADSEFQVKCYGEYLRIAKDAEAAAKGHTWRVVKVLHQYHADMCRETAKAHLSKHLEIEARIRQYTNSLIGVNETGMVDPSNVLGLK